MDIRPPEKTLQLRGRGRLGRLSFWNAWWPPSGHISVFAGLVLDLAEGTLCERGSAENFPLIATIAGEPFMLARSVLQVLSHSFGGRRQGQHANTDRLSPVARNRYP